MSARSGRGALILHHDFGDSALHISSAHIDLGTPNSQTPDPAKPQDLMGWCSIRLVIQVTEKAAQYVRAFGEGGANPPPRLRNDANDSALHISSAHIDLGTPTVRRLAQRSLRISWVGVQSVSSFR
jgi:hypothetical protein